MAVNLNELAIKVTKAEAGLEQVSIAQVKEVINETLKALAQEDPTEVLETLQRYRIP